MKASKLQRVIDEMVARSIRRLLPEIMNEVLLRTVARSGIVEERVPAPAPARRPRPARRAPSSLSEILDESAGAEFYERSAPAPALAQRINQLPPELRTLAEDTVEQMSAEPAGQPSVDLNEAAGLGFDFGRMRAALGIVEEKAPRPLLKDPAMEERRIAQLRERLEVKPGN